MTGAGRPPRAAPPRPAPPQRAAPEGGLRVVVVDDDPRWREVAAEPFRKRGDHVRVTADGLQALAMCLEDPPDVILTDVQMPRMDGWQLLRLIRSRPALAATPVVFMTSLDGDAERLKGYQLGVDGYVPKPFAAEELLVRVVRLLRQKRAGSSNSGQKIVLKGELEQVSAASVLSFIAVEKKSGVLLVVGERVARVFIRDGRPLRAELEGPGTRLASRAVLLEILDWTSGQFELSEEPVSGSDEVGSEVSSLVLEHARMVDERRR